MIDENALQIHLTARQIAVAEIFHGFTFYPVVMITAKHSQRLKVKVASMPGITQAILKALPDYEFNTQLLQAAGRKRTRILVITSPYKKHLQKVVSLIQKNAA